MRPNAVCRRPVASSISAGRPISLGCPRAARSTGRSVHSTSPSRETVFRRICSFIFLLLLWCLCVHVSAVADTLSGYVVTTLVDRRSASDAYMQFIVWANAAPVYECDTAQRPATPLAVSVKIPVVLDDDTEFYFVVLPGYGSAWTFRVNSALTFGVDGQEVPCCGGCACIYVSLSCRWCCSVTGRSFLCGIVFSAA